jgi:Penicillin-insensitive murein endopeptidase
VRPARLAVAVGVLVGLLALGVLVAAATGTDRTPRPAADPRPTTTEWTATERTTTEAATAPAAPRTWRARGRGVAVTFPEDWTLATDGADFADPGLCFQLSTEPRSPRVDFHGSRVEPDGVEIRVVELLSGRHGDNRPPTLRLADVTAPGGVEWTRGGLLTFDEDGRSIYVGVLIGPEASSETVQQVESVLNSLEVARSGRCLVPRPTAWRESTPLGSPSFGRLVNGVQVPEQGPHFFTYDPVLRRSPNRPWRRWGTDGLVRIALRVVNEFARAHPEAPRVGIGDLSRPRGGYFGPKHATHENGLDVDVYYPRLDRRERPPRRASQVDRALAQDLVDRFVAAGATRVYVGPNVGLTGPAGIVRVIPNHDNHLHARIPKRLA